MLAFDAVKGANIAAYSESVPSQSLVEKDPVAGTIVSERQIIRRTSNIFRGCAFEQQPTVNHQVDDSLR